MKKGYVLILIVLLTIGFASISTTLILNGKVDVSLLENDLEVVFKEVLLNGTTIDDTFIIENGKSFIYTINDLNKVNDTSKIDYVVMNKSHQYDVEVSVSCVTDYEENISYEGVFDNNKLPLEKGILIGAGEVKLGNIITKLIKNVTDESLALKCTLEYVPISRESTVNEEEHTVTFNTDSELSANSIKVKYYEEYGKLPELKRNGYNFLGWYDEKDNKIENNSLVKIKGNHTLKAKWKYICPYNLGKEWLFNYTGAEQAFPVPCDGNYKIELWGAQGGDIATYIGGRGGYTLGDITLTQNKNLYIYVGGQGTNTDVGGYNGGTSLVSGQSLYGSSGGGATDIRLVNGVWDNFDSLKSRIMVAAGGGGANNRNGNGNAYYGAGNGGAGGGLNGIDGQTVNYTSSAGTYNAHSYGTGGMQTSGGTRILLNSSNVVLHTSVTGIFGSTNYMIKDVNIQSGAGGGYYGGGSSDHGGAGGGSSFISGHNGCDAILKTSVSSNIVHSGQPNHYSGLIFTNTNMVAGNASMPNHANTGSMIGNSGNGYAKITYLGD